MPLFKQGKKTLLSVIVFFTNHFFALQNGNSDDAVEVCTEAHKLNPDDPYVLCDRADAYINAERFDEG